MQYGLNNSSARELRESPEASAEERQLAASLRVFSVRDVINARVATWDLEVGGPGWTGAPRRPRRP